MDLVLFLPFLALFGVIIYMQTRQRKRMQTKQSELQASLSIGAPVMLTCGLHGDVADMDETTIDVEIAPGVIATFARAAVLEVRGTESTFVDDTDGDTADDSADDRSADDRSADDRGADDGEASIDGSEQKSVPVTPPKSKARGDSSA